MGTGISMSSVNKIKELAENGDYSLALDILEHQDLSRSLSPQFIRICGEVYFENKRYPEARGALVRAHAMAPVGNKIIYSIIRLYLTMGYRSLAEKYYEIFRFNQENKDAYTLRIEYMIAKSKRKPVNELYSILLAANDMETDENWDFEMLVLHAYIRNKEKFESACEEFRAKYRNSSKLYMLGSLMDESTDLESLIYCYPEDEISDDDPAEEKIRQEEQKILAEDELRLHPKDAKIMIMVEDDAPVSSSMKLKQMFIRSKEKKEQKREQKKEQRLEDEEPSEGVHKKSRGFFDRMSKKEEELVRQEIEELKEESTDREKLLAEVVSGQSGDEEDQVNDHGDGRRIELTPMPDLESDNMQDMTQISDDRSEEERAVYNTERAVSDITDIDEDSFVIEEEPEELVMVDIDFDNETDSGDESDTAASKISDAEAQAEKAPQESFDPAFDFDKAFESLEEFAVDDIYSEDLSIEQPELCDENIPQDFKEPEPVSTIEADEQPEAEPLPEEVEPEPEDTQPVQEESAKLLPEKEEPENEDIPDSGEYKFENSPSEKAKNAEYPVFKSSLFPDYNTDGAQMYEINKGQKNSEIDAEEQKISENLKKEEDLIGETDRLLARLGIRFNTEFNSIFKFDDSENCNDDTETDDSNKEDFNDGSATHDQDASKSEDDHNNKKKSFKLKG